MKTIKALRISLVSLVIVVILALVGATITAFVLVRKPLPDTSGQLTAEGLQAEAQIARDSWGIPEITAQSSTDLFFAQGFAHAQDRFFEMDYRRHMVAGRLAELVGNEEAAISADKAIRTMGWYHVAQIEWDLLAPETQEYFEAYAAGVNAYIADKKPSDLALEYTVLGLQVDIPEIEPWSPVDSVAWLKAMAWDLKGNFDAELDRARTYGALGDRVRTEQLFPEHSVEIGPPITPEYTVPSAKEPSAKPFSSTGEPLQAGSAQSGENGMPLQDIPLQDEGLQEAMAEAESLLGAIPNIYGEGEGLGSNSWVVDGQHTTTGMPLLANDPHLSMSAPGIWYQNTVRCAVVSEDCPFDLSGYSFAGVPGVIIGHNNHLAWGFTNLTFDVTDFFVEVVSGIQYAHDANWLDLEQRDEVIKVAGGEDINFTVYSTMHGPIVSPSLVDAGLVEQLPEFERADTAAGGYQVSLAWTALQPGNTADGLFKLNLAQDSEDIASAAQSFTVPAQNIVFATVDGDIGYQAPGVVPQRNPNRAGQWPSDGSWPRPGWNSYYDWQGYVDFADLPAQLNPDSGVIMTANQVPLAPGAHPQLDSDFDYGYRAGRLDELLGLAIEAGVKFDAADMAAMQMDSHSSYAEVLMPYIDEIDGLDDYTMEAVQLLHEWDYQQTTESGAALYLAAVWSNLLDATFQDELPESLWPDGGGRWLAVMSELLENPEDPWWDDITTPAVVETRDEILSHALVTARLELTTAVSNDVKRWQWGDLHQAGPQHGVLGGEGIPAPIQWLFNIDSMPVAGGQSTVNANAWDASSGTYAVTNVPSMRMVVDMENFDESTWISLTGNSAHPGSKHYSDQFSDWASGVQHPWLYSPEALANEDRDVLILTP